MPAIAEVKRLEKYFDKQLNPDQKEVFVFELDRFSDELISQAVSRALRERRTMPTVADLIQYIDEKCAEAKYENHSAKIECHRCKGCGLIEIWHIDATNQRWEAPYCRPMEIPHAEATRYVGRCHCFNGSKYSGIPLAPENKPAKQLGEFETEEEMVPWD